MPSVHPPPPPATPLPYIGKGHNRKRQDRTKYERTVISNSINESQSTQYCPNTPVDECYIISQQYYTAQNFF